MKQMTGLVILFALFIALTPAIALLSPNKSDLKDAIFKPGETPDSIVNSEPEKQKYDGGSILVLDEASGQTLSLTEREYVIGAVLCEMPALYEPDALKAQAIATHTYALFVKDMREAAPLPELAGAYFKVNTSAFSGYMTKDQAEVHFGNNFEKYYSKITAAVDSTLDTVLKYDGKLISACYHAISPGKTENSENVFSSSAPYLVSVDSSWDSGAEGFETVVALTPGELSDMLGTAKQGFIPSGAPSEWLGDTSYTDAGTVSGINICGVALTGTELRSMLQLRSAAFTARFEDDKFVFTVHGYGHGVGMSQYGANCMAKSGKSYKEILAHYYKNTNLSAA
ncbi:MAG: stage II sporulation protein D [Oscillospiraceae bacterium]